MKEKLVARLAEIERKNKGPKTWASGADIQWLIEKVREQQELGNDLVDAVLTAAPSTMYPKIVRDAINAWDEDEP